MDFGLVHFVQQQSAMNKFFPLLRSLSILSTFEHLLDVRFNRILARVEWFKAKSIGMGYVCACVYVMLQLKIDNNTGICLAVTTDSFI